MRALDHRVPPPFLMLAIGALMALSIPLGPPMMPAAVRWSSTALFFVAAGVFAFPAFAAFAKAKTTIDPVQLDRASSLVTTGIYRLTRNPMYVGLTFLLCAWAAWLGQPVTTAGPIAFALFIDRFQIVPEERVLAATFGEPYVAYCRSVRRWI